VTSGCPSSPRTSPIREKGFSVHPKVKCPLTCRADRLLLYRMVDRSSPKLDRVFHALADGTRRRILFQVARSDCTVSELSRPFTLSPAAISKHLKVLERAGILHRVKTGKFHRFRLDTGSFTKAQQVMDELTTFWQQRIDQLENYLDHDLTPNQRKTNEHKP
jgi:DNA-binding transcriptional ArsR family regulator